MITACNSEEMGVSTESARVRRNDAAPADELLAFNRSYNERRVFLRHTERVTVDIFVNNEIADY